MTFSFGLDVPTGDCNCRVEGNGSLEDGKRIEVTAKVMTEGLPTVHQHRQLNMQQKNHNKRVVIANNLESILTEMVLEATNNPKGRISEEGRQNIREWVHNVIY